jgi:hypothetical protein
LKTELIQNHQIFLNSGLVFIIIECGTHRAVVFHWHTDGQQLVFSFKPPPDAQPSPDISYHKALRDFVNQELNERLTNSDTITLMNLNPESFLRVCQSTFPELNVSLFEVVVLYVSRGFQQEIRFAFFFKSEKDKRSHAPLITTVLQYSNQDDAFAAFIDKVAFFERWPTHLRRNLDVNNYAFETDSCIF